MTSLTTLESSAPSQQSCPHCQSVSRGIFVSPSVDAHIERMSMQLIAAQEEERRRISRDLHDHVGQILTALKMQLASMARKQSIADPAQALQASMSLAEEALRQTRDLTASLHPHLLEDLGLEPALNWLIERFIRPSLPDVELRCRLTPPRSAGNVELVAFRVVQEALTNVVRHANATRIGIIMEARNATLRIEIIDDGEGFDAGNTCFALQQASSVGLAAMQKRVSELGGDLILDSTPGVGTSVRAVLPWSQNGAGGRDAYLAG